MKVAWYSGPLALAPADRALVSGPQGRLIVATTSSTRLHAVHMNYRCNCGMQYVVIPKEIPLVKDEGLICHNCGCKLKGRWSSRYFDYQPFRVLPEEESSDR